MAVGVLSFGKHCLTIHHSEFEQCEVLYINEPPEGTEVNCVWGKQGEGVCDRVYTKRDVDAGEELFLYYGPMYQYRDYRTTIPTSTWYVQEETLAGDSSRRELKRCS